MHKLLTGVMLTAVLSFVGCGSDVHEAAAPPPPVDSIDHGPDVHPDDHMARGAEGRAELRENMREAVDSVNIEVGDGGVKVDVDGE